MVPVVPIYRDVSGRMVTMVMVKFRVTAFFLF